MKDLITRLRSQGSKSFLVIFVSDGHDGYNSGEHLVLSGRGFNTEGVEFTTVGVGYGFPTHVSMSLRNAFHQGRVNIPNVTLVEELENFEVDFSRMAGEILGCSGQKVTLDAPTKVSAYVGDSLQLCLVFCHFLMMNQAIGCPANSLSIIRIGCIF